MIETAKEPIPAFTPKDMANLAIRKGGLAHTQQVETRPETPEEIPLPKEGGIYEEDGRRYRFVPVTYHTSVPARDSLGGFRDIEYPYTLRTWFSHTSQTPSRTYINGPGHDQRHNLLSTYTPEQMLRRFGHVFTDEEISYPAGKEDFRTGESTGGMPDDIPYFDIKSIDADSAPDA